MESVLHLVFLDDKGGNMKEIKFASRPYVNKIVNAIEWLFKGRPCSFVLLPSLSTEIT